MTDLERFQLINKCETSEKLSAAILVIAEDGIIKGRRSVFQAINLAAYVPGVIAGTLPPNVLTREFGIRQQAFYIMYYEQMKKLYENTENTENTDN